MANPSRIFGCDIELRQALKMWDKEFCQKLKETGQKFESVAIRPLYTGKTKKKVLKIKKWT
tara:strand:- start:1725 stop:1907 length:183 start_codon:yes stop_codon:yes gene_type:complete